LENLHVCAQDCGADDETDMQYTHCIEYPVCPEQQNMLAALHVPGLVRPTLQLQRQAETVLLIHYAIKTWRNQAGKKKMDRMHQWFTSFM
jgi:hypothetical protein